MVDLLKSTRNYIGPIEEDDEKAIYDDIESGAKPSKDYFLMVALSCIMATFGLLLNNVAVIIGAMLVAPLMTSIITMALGIVRGDFKLFFKAAEAEAKGALLVIILSVFITLFFPISGDLAVTPEIESRTLPDLFFLFIALSAGAAGAYAISRPKLSTMLPGVAIAVAILPPLATIGIGLGLRRFDVALGALLLFLTNLISISLASTLVFWVLGVGPKRKGAKEEQLKGNLRKTLYLLILISIPLAWIMYSTLDDLNTKTVIENTIGAKLLGISQAELMEFDHEFKNGNVEVTATIRTAGEIDQEQIDIMKNALESELDRDVSLTVEIVSLRVLES